jgi:hypothetical protein
MADTARNDAAVLQALATYVPAQAVVDLLAEAWLALSDEDHPRTNIDVSLLPIGYLNDDWTKMAGRVLRGYAEHNQRPDTWPWRNSRFDAIWAVAEKARRTD